ncbi:hypothetical protein NDU88_005559 [Pleurodeles waltl]|uniref:Uncharacterized protein n=1 Tax=Pleurodeles waltl TaxID=8319 RepID=A0AAV7UJ29_PLEWA|nr:hypothetical protein NDU88_005559 [Pleurodeles waltl]
MSRSVTSDLTGASDVACGAMPLLHTAPSGRRRGVKGPHSGARPKRKAQGRRHAPREDGRRLWEGPVTEEEARERDGGDCEWAQYSHPMALEPILGPGKDEQARESHHAPCEDVDG